MAIERNSKEFVRKMQEWKERYRMHKEYKTYWSKEWAPRVAE